MFYFLGAGWRGCGPRAHAQGAYLNFSRKTNTQFALCSSLIWFESIENIWFACLLVARLMFEHNEKKNVETGTFVHSFYFMWRNSRCRIVVYRKLRKSVSFGIFGVAGWPIVRVVCISASHMPHAIKHHIQMPAKLAMKLVFINFNSMTATIWAPRSNVDNDDRSITAFARE